jgi:hypothetical protein
VDLDAYLGDRCATYFFLGVVFRPKLERGQELVRHREKRALGPVWNDTITKLPQLALRPHRRPDGRVDGVTVGSRRVDAIDANFNFG